jgi:hypothetical protein
MLIVLRCELAAGNETDAAFGFPEGRVVLVG